MPREPSNQASENQEYRGSPGDLPLPGGRDRNGACARRRLGRDSSSFRVPLQAFQIGPQFRGRLTPDLAIFFQRFIDHFLQLERNCWIQAHWRNRRPIQNRIEDHSRSIATERQHSRAHLIENRAEGEQIRAGIEFFSPNLFRAHVSHRSDRDPGTGQVFLVMVAVGDRMLLRPPAGLSVSLASPKSSTFA